MMNKIDSIIKTFTVMSTKLEKIIESKKGEVTKNNSTIKNIEEVNKMCSEDIDRATNIKTKIDALIE